MAKMSLKQFNWKEAAIVIVTLILGLLGGNAMNLAIRPTEEVLEVTQAIELSDEQVDAVITTEEGVEELVDVPTVENVETNQVISDDEPDEGLGAYHDTSTPQAYRDAVLGACTDVDGKYGAQCFDLASDFWKNYTGRWLSSCGTGAAKGTTNCWEQNAGDEFEMIWDKTQLQAGDWVVFDSGQYGHIGMAMGSYNNGYITLLGQNQGGKSCSGGGSTANIINISLASFKGAFRPKTYIKTEPTPEPTVVPVSGCVEWAVKRGDTLSGIMLSCENTVVYGEAMDAYAKTWFSTIVKPGQSVYDGWHSASGVGLYYDDLITHKTE